MFRFQTIKFLFPLSVRIFPCRASEKNKPRGTTLLIQHDPSEWEPATHRGSAATGGGEEEVCEWQEKVSLPLPSVTVFEMGEATHRDANSAVNSLKMFGVAANTRMKTYC